MISLGLKDKNQSELFAGDKVQIVNGANAGQTLHKIRAAKKAYTIEGDLSTNPKEPASLQILSRKVVRLTKTVQPAKPAAPAKVVQKPPKPG